MGASCVRSDGCTDTPTAKRMMKSRFDCHILSISSTDIGQAHSAIDEDKALCLVHGVSYGRTSSTAASAAATVVPHEAELRGGEGEGWGGAWG